MYKKSKHILGLIIFLLENRAVYEIMWKKAVERGRSQMTVLFTLFVCWILKAFKHTLSEYEMLIAFLLKQWLNESASMLLVRILIAFMKVTNNLQLYRLIYFSLSALRVSGDVFAHYQEHLTLFTVSGSVHPSCYWLVSCMS